MLVEVAEGIVVHSCTRPTGTLPTVVHNTSLVTPCGSGDLCLFTHATGAVRTTNTVSDPSPTGYTGSGFAGVVSGMAIV